MTSIRLKPKSTAGEAFYTTSRAVQMTLARSPSRAVREALAKNPQLDLDVQLVLAEDEPSVRYKLATNRNVAYDVADAMLAGGQHVESHCCPCALASNQGLHEALHMHVVANGSVPEIARLGGNPNISKAAQLGILDFWQKNPDVFPTYLARTLASNVHIANLTQLRIIGLTQDGSSILRDYLARNPRLTDDAMRAFQALEHDPYRETLNRTLARNPTYVKFLEKEAHRKIYKFIREHPPTK